MKADDPHPNRPTHPDFARLSEVVTKMDERSREPGFQVTGDVSGLIDPGSLIYMAAGRVDGFGEALKAAGIPAHLITEPLASAAWIDGFVAGATFAEQKANR